MRNNDTSYDYLNFREGEYSNKNCKIPVSLIVGDTNMSKNPKINEVFVPGGPCLRT